jgi:hypothetical protein
MPGEDLSWGGGVTLNQFLGGMGEQSSWGGGLTQRQLVDAGGTPGVGEGSPTSLSIINRNANTFDIASSTGLDATVPAATTLLAGLLTAADKSLLDSLGLIAAALAPVATSGAYADLSGRPTLGNAAARNVGTGAGTVAAGDDARFSDARAPLSHTQPASSISDSTAAGRELLTALDVPAQQTLLGLQPVALSGSYSDLAGTPSLGNAAARNVGTVAGTVAAGDDARLGDARTPTAHGHGWGEITGTPTTLSGYGITDAQPLTFASASIAYAATVDLDMATLTGLFRTISLTGNLSLTASNRAAGRTVTLRLVCDGTLRTLTVPAGWVFLGSKPANIAASKTGVLSLTFFGTADTDCVAAYGVQA